MKNLHQSDDNVPGTVTMQSHRNVNFVTILTIVGVFIGIALAVFFIWSTTPSEHRPFSSVATSTALDSNGETAGLKTQLRSGVYLPVKIFEEQNTFPVYGKACETVRNQTQGSSYECSSIFFNANNTVHLYAPTNAGFPSDNRILAFPDADPESFQYLSTFVGFDDAGIHYAEYVRDVEDSIQGIYVATSTPITDEERVLLKKYTLNNEIGIEWIRTPQTITGDFVIESYAPILKERLRKDFVEIHDAQGPLLRMYADYVHPQNVQKIDNALLLFTDDGLYEITIGSEPKLLYEKDSRYSYYVSGSDTVYYLESFSAPAIVKFHIPSRTVQPLALDDPRKFINATALFVTADERRIYTRATWSLDDVSNESNTASAVLEIDAVTGKILSEIPYEVERYGSLFPFAVSPNKKYVFNIPIPYEGYLFDEMQYYYRMDNGEWSERSTTFQDFRLEVGGGWNVRTGQWMLSPDQATLAASDAKELYTARCPGMGDSPSIQNQLKLLILDDLKEVVVKELGQWEEFSLSHWSSDGSGLYYRVVTFEPQTCTTKGISELTYLKI